MLTIGEVIKTFYSAILQKLKRFRGNWEQNDPTADDYIKNRPFYTGDPVETVLVEEITALFTEHNGVYRMKGPPIFVATVGETYKISWDSTVYKCTCVDSSGATIIGNLSIMDAGSDTGESFLILVRNGIGIFIYTLDTSASHTFSISGFIKEVVKIDEKYLPTITADKIPAIPATKLPIISFIMDSSTSATGTCNTTYKDAVNLVMNGNIRAFLTDNANYYYCVSASKGKHTAYGGNCLIFKFIKESFKTANTFTTETKYAILSTNNHVTII